MENKDRSVSSSSLPKGNASDSGKETKDNRNKSSSSTRSSPRPSSSSSSAASTSSRPYSRSKFGSNRSPYPSRTESDRGNGRGGGRDNVSVSSPAPPPPPPSIPNYPSFTSSSFPTRTQGSTSSDPRVPPYGNPWVSSNQQGIPAVPMLPSGGGNYFRNGTGTTGTLPPPPSTGSSSSSNLYRDPSTLGNPGVSVAMFEAGLFRQNNNYSMTGGYTGSGSGGDGGGGNLSTSSSFSSITQVSSTDTTTGSVASSVYDNRNGGIGGGGTTTPGTSTFTPLFTGTVPVTSPNPSSNNLLFPSQPPSRTTATTTTSSSSLMTDTSSYPFGSSALPGGTLPNSGSTGGISNVLSLSSSSASSSSSLSSSSSSSTGYPTLLPFHTTNVVTHKNTVTSNATDSTVHPKPYFGSFDNASTMTVPPDTSSVSPSHPSASANPGYSSTNNVSPVPVLYPHQSVAEVVPNHGITGIVAVLSTTGQYVQGSAYYNLHIRANRGEFTIVGTLKDYNWGIYVLPNGNWYAIEPNTGCCVNIPYSYLPGINPPPSKFSGFLPYPDLPSVSLNGNQVSSLLPSTGMNMPYPLPVGSGVPSTNLLNPNLLSLTMNMMYPAMMGNTMNTLNPLQQSQQQQLIWNIMNQLMMNSGGTGSTGIFNPSLISGMTGGEPMASTGSTVTTTTGTTGTTGTGSLVPSGPVPLSGSTTISSSPPIPSDTVPMVPPPLPPPPESSSLASVPSTTSSVVPSIPTDQPAVPSPSGVVESMLTGLSSTSPILTTVGFPPSVPRTVETKVEPTEPPNVGGGGGTLPVPEEPSISGESTKPKPTLAPSVARLFEAVQKEKEKEAEKQLAASTVNIPVPSVSTLPSSLSETRPAETRTAPVPTPPTKPILVPSVSSMPTAEKKKSVPPPVPSVRDTGTFGEDSNIASVSPIVTVAPSKVRPMMEVTIGPIVRTLPVTTAAERVRSSLVPPKGTGGTSTPSKQPGEEIRSRSAATATATVTPPKETTTTDGKRSRKSSAGDVSQESEGHRWNCLKCTFSNSMNDDNCTMCGTPNPALTVSFNPDVSSTSFSSTTTTTTDTPFTKIGTGKGRGHRGRTGLGTGLPVVGGGSIFSLLEEEGETTTVPKETKKGKKKTETVIPSPPPPPPLVTEEAPPVPKVSKEQLSQMAKEKEQEENEWLSTQIKMAAEEANRLAAEAKSNPEKATQPKTKGKKRTGSTTTVTKPKTPSASSSAAARTTPAVSFPRSRYNASEFVSDLKHSDVEYKKEYLDRESKTKKKEGETVTATTAAASSSTSSSSSSTPASTVYPPFKRSVMLPPLSSEDETIVKQFIIPSLETYGSMEPAPPTYRIYATEPLSSTKDKKETRNVTGTEALMMVWDTFLNETLDTIAFRYYIPRNIDSDVSKDPEYRLLLQIVNHERGLFTSEIMKYEESNYKYRYFLTYIWSSPLIGIILTYRLLPLIAYIARYFPSPLESGSKIKPLYDQLHPETNKVIGHALQQVKARSNNDTDTDTVRSCVSTLHLSSSLTQYQYPSVFIPHTLGLAPLMEELQLLLQSKASSPDPHVVPVIMEHDRLFYRIEEERWGGGYSFPLATVAGVWDTDLGKTMNQVYTLLGQHPRILPVLECMEWFRCKNYYVGTMEDQLANPRKSTMEDPSLTAESRKMVNKFSYTTDRYKFTTHSSEFGYKLPFVWLYANLKMTVNVKHFTEMLTYIGNYPNLIRHQYPMKVCTSVHPLPFTIASESSESSESSTVSASSSSSSSSAAVTSSSSVESVNDFAFPDMLTKYYKTDSELTRQTTLDPVLLFLENSRRRLAYVYKVLKDRIGSTVSPPPLFTNLYESTYLMNLSSTDLKSMAQDLLTFQKNPYITLIGQSYMDELTMMKEDPTISSVRNMSPSSSLSSSTDHPNYDMDRIYAYFLGEGTTNQPLSLGYPSSILTLSNISLFLRDPKYKEISMVFPPYDWVLRSLVYFHPLVPYLRSTIEQDKEAIKSLLRQTEHTRRFQFALETLYEKYESFMITLLGIYALFTRTHTPMDPYKVYQGYPSTYTMYIESKIPVTTMGTSDRTGTLTDLRNDPLTGPFRMEGDALLKWISERFPFPDDKNDNDDDNDDNDDDNDKDNDDDEFDDEAKEEEDNFRYFLSEASSLKSSQRNNGSNTDENEDDSNRNV